MEQSWRRKIYHLIDPDEHSLSNKIYDGTMLVCIVASLIPLAFREQTPLFVLMDLISVSFFIVDYLFRWLTADYRMPDKAPWKAFVIYPFTAFAIIDLLSILPSFVFFHRAFKLLRISRMLKIMRVFKFIRYSKNIKILATVLHKEKNILITVFWIAIGYIFITALFMFNVEDSEMFADFFDAIYWATMTLTTVGYGDIYPSSDFGRIISMFSAVFGVAIIALPSGVITASYMDELREEKKKKGEC